MSVGWVVFFTRPNGNSAEERKRWVSRGAGPGSRRRIGRNARIHQHPFLHSGIIAGIALVPLHRKQLEEVRSVGVSSE
jgi:hypothetical protein